MSEIGSLAPSRISLIGVGASAGGLEAFQQLLGALDGTDRFALILVQHLDPDHESLLPELLARRSRLPVVPITDGMEVEPGNIYLIPPAFGLTMEGRRLKLEPFPAPRGLRRPIDSFFHALAREHGGEAAGIILSGTGSDGANGIRAIKEGGGLVFAQDPRDAVHTGMPAAAIATGAVDLVLPAADMIGVLRDFQHRATDIAPLIASDAEFIAKVMRHVRYRTGHDFSGYKTGTLLRRITLRMSVLGLVRPGDYLRRLVEDRLEAERLFRDLLVNVTRFFRDPDAFAALSRTALPHILATKEDGDEIRVWVPGCSTGQEAYTVAMILAEAKERLAASFRFSVFGSDIDEEALAVARRGRYPDSIASELPPGSLERFFKVVPSGFEVRAELRDRVRFSAQSLVRDPPFSRLDLITCRNLMIYLSGELQDLTQQVFRYALRPGGVLMLGQAETLRQSGEGFAPLVPEQRIYSRGPGPARPPDLLRPAPGPIAAEAPRAATMPGGLPPALATALLSHHMPPFLLVGPDDGIVRVGPGAERFLRVEAGVASLDLRRLILPEFEAAVRRLLALVALADGALRRIRVEAPEDGTLGPVIVSAERLEDGTRLVTFAEALAHAGDQIQLDESYVTHLEQELDEARQRLRGAVADLETTNEELKTSNEQMMSMNEELQSANEELSATNQELQSRLAELAEANADWTNLMASTGIATVFLDRRMRLRSFTPAATRWFRFVPQDRGREIVDIGSRLDMGAIIAACHRIIEGGESEELALAADGGEETMVRFAPYREAGPGQGGVVFSVFDVTAVVGYARAAEEAGARARASAREIEELYLGSPLAMGLVDRDYRYLRANLKMADFAGRGGEGLVGRSIAEVQPELAGRMVASVARVLETGRPVLRQILRGHAPGDPALPRVWEIDWYPVHLAGEGGAIVRAVGLNVTEVTRLLELQADLRRMMRELQHRVKNMLSNVIALVNRAGREPGEPRDVLETLGRRIRALAGTHNLLTNENWASAALRDVLALELLDIRAADRVTLRGPEVRLNARATLSLGMVIHELATNATRHGAFREPGGHVRVQWSRVDEGEGDQFRLVWQESGGPEVGEPAREGFGLKLMRSAIEGAFDGTLACAWEPAGLRLVVSLPWRAATEVDYDSELDPLRHADPLP